MPSRTAVVTASVLNVRPTPSTERASVARLDRGAKVEILERAGSWYKIRQGALEGFVHGDFVRIAEARQVTGFLHERPELQGALLPAPAEEQRPTAGLRDSPLRAAQTWNRYGGLLVPLCELTAVERAAAVAVLLTESSGSGFRNGRMIIRFENHVFERQWGDADGRFAAHFRYDPSRKWTRHEFREGNGPWQPCHTSQDTEWRVFELARTLNEPAALRSISMGAPQIMGFNASRIGYDSAKEMFDKFVADERYHLLGMFDFVAGPGSTSPMLEALQQGRYEAFASHYNGLGKAAQYAERLRAYHDAFLAGAGSA
jgi:hypothetical protein